MPAELLEQLGVLGYLGAGSKGVEPTREDPKDKVDELPYNLALVLLRQNRLEDATRWSQVTLDLDPGFDAARHRLDRLGS